MMKTASATILSDKKVLLVKRIENTQHFPGHWAFPGGRPEAGEDPEQTVVREVKEETNLDFTPVELFMKGRYPGREMYRFLGTWAGNIQLQADELTDYGWFTYSEAIRLPLAFDYKKVIEQLFATGHIK